MLFKVLGSGGRRQRTLAIRIAAITLASDSAITITQFRPSEGDGKTHKLFQHKLFAPAQNAPFWTPRKKLMCLISWERTQQRDPHKCFWGEFGGQKRAPKQAIFGHKSLVYCFSCPYLNNHAIMQHDQSNLVDPAGWPESGLPCFLKSLRRAYACTYPSLPYASLTMLNHRFAALSTWQQTLAGHF